MGNVFENAKDEIKDVSDILEEDKKIHGERFPDNCDLFRAFSLTHLHKVRVVILGMDPYAHKTPDGRPTAVGLAFSVRRDAPIPSSLRNIFKEIKNCIPDFNIPSHGDLTSWAIQGILLLNSSLTVRESESGCFKELWFGILKKVINAILSSNPKCIFVAWGKDAQKITKKFVGERAIVLEAAHPSGLSANRGFFGCNHFSEINKILVSQKTPPIDWNLY